MNILSLLSLRCVAETVAEQEIAIEIVVEINGNQREGEIGRVLKHALYCNFIDRTIVYSKLRDHLIFKEIGKHLYNVFELFMSKITFTPAISQLSHMVQRNK